MTYKINFLKDIFYTTLLTGFIYCNIYFLSSKEVVFDYKNISFLFLYTFIWMKIYKVYKISLISKVTYYISFVILGLIIPYIGYKTDPFMIKRMMKDFLFFYSFPLIFLLVPLVFNKERIRKFLLCTYFIILILIVLLLSTLTSYYLMFDVKLSVDSVVAIMQTNYSETIEFLLNYILSINSFIYILIISCALFLLSRFIKIISANHGDVFSKKWLILLFIGINISSIMFYSKSYIIRTINSAINLNDSLIEFKEYSENRVKVLAECERKYGYNKNFALVIGETHTRKNMSIYGYNRNTTPWLDDAVKNNKVIDFKNSYSCAAQTQPALELALTEKSQYNNVNLKDAMTIIEMAKHSGFYVVWITNHTKDTIAGLIADEADETVWINDSTNDTYQYQKNGIYDKLILDYLKNTDKKEQKTLYVIHLLGSHASYDCRYPEKFNFWDDINNKINAYDNSVLYNDYVMSQMYDLLLKKLDVSGMVYFADHGEELEYYFCHGTDFFVDNYEKYDSVKSIIEIPVYIALSEDYKQEHKEIYYNLLSNRDKYYTNDMIYDTVLGIMGIKCCHYNNKQDLSSSEYNKNNIELLTIHGKYKIKDFY